MPDRGEMRRILESDRWLYFQESTARGLNLCLTMVGPEGALVGVPRACPVCGAPCLPVDGDALSIAIATAQGDAQPVSVGDRRGAVAALGDGWAVVGQACPCIASGGRTSVVERLNVVRKLLGSFRGALQEGIVGGRRAVEMSALRQMNRITLSLFRREDDAVDRALDLLLSAMVILLEAPASWLEYRSHGRQQVLYRGDEVTARRAQASGDGVMTWEESQGGLWCRLGVVHPQDHEWATTLLPVLAQESVIVLENDRLLRLLQDQVARVLGGVGSTVLLVDQGGIITYANAAASDLLGSSAVQLLNLSAADLEAPWQRALLDRTPEPTRGRMERLGPPDRRRWLDWEVSPLRDGGSIVGWLVMAHDRTDLHRWRQASRQAERMATTATLVNSLAHELRNPLAAARGLVELAPRQSDPDKATQFLQVALRELDRITALLNQFMLLGRPARMAPEPLDLAAFLKDLLPVLQGEAAGAQVEIRTELRPVLPVNGDPAQLSQVVMNLVRNGTEAAGPGGWVSVQLHHASGGAVLTVVDSGPGLAAGAADKLFEPFFTMKKGGVGLGLAVSQAIVLNHGGRITAANIPGAGAAFTVWLPVRQQQRPQPSNLDVLLIMTHPIARAACKQAMQVSGLTVEVAPKLQDALAVISQFRPGVIILDTTALRAEEIAQLRAAVPGAPMLVAGEPRAWQGPAGVAFLDQPLDYVAVIEQVEALLQPAQVPLWVQEGVSD